MLIVAPLRVAKHTWKDEIEKFDDFHGIRYSIVVGTAKERLAALKADADVYIINRENIPWLIENSGVPFDFDMLVIDELSSFKNWQSKRFKALMKVRPFVKRVVGLTGTPTGSGGYMSLFAEFKVLDCGLRLGRLISQYRSWYFRPLATNGHIVFSYGLLPGAEDLINEKISDITISMKSVDHLDMPELIQTEHPVYLDDAEMKRYKEMKDDLILTTDTGEVTAANAAALSSKLIQMSNGAVYLDDGTVNHIHDKKLDALEDIIESCVGSPLLVSYWYKHDKARIEERLKQMKVSYEFIDKDDSIERWNRGEIAVGLVHPQSCAHGLNLQESGSNTMAIFGNFFSVELHDQLIARLYRQGQKHKTVTVIHIITKGTIDEKIMKTLSDGNTTQEALLDAVKAQF